MLKWEKKDFSTWIARGPEEIMEGLIEKMPSYWFVEFRQDGNFSVDATPALRNEVFRAGIDMGKVCITNLVSGKEWCERMEEQLKSKNPTVKAGQFYRHRNGALYRIIAMARHSETGNQLVIYEPMPGTVVEKQNEVYARPLEMFCEPGRFRLVEDPKPEDQEEFPMPTACEAWFKNDFGWRSDRELAARAWQAGAEYERQLAKDVEEIFPTKNPSSVLEGNQWLCTCGTANLKLRSRCWHCRQPAPKITVTVNVGGVDGTAELSVTDEQHVCGLSGFVEANGTCPRCDAEACARLDAREKAAAIVVNDKVKMEVDAIEARAWDEVERIAGTPLPPDSTSDIMRGDRQTD